MIRYLKRHYVAAALLVVLAVLGFARAGGHNMFAFPFLGRWQPSEDPILIDEHGFQDIQNLRREGNHLKGVKGHQKVNQDPVDATYTHPRAGFHFLKDDPDESHVLLQVYDAAYTKSAIFENETPIPNIGPFSGTTLHQDDSDAETGRFSTAPNGNVAYCNGAESRIWGGDQMAVAGFLVVRDPAESPADFWDSVFTNDSNTYVSLSGATQFYVGSNRRLNGVRLHVLTANASACVMSVEEYRSDGAWHGSGATTDGTAVGGAALARSGWVTWTCNTDTRATFIEDGDQLAYWYRFTVTGADGATSLYYITGAEGGFQHVENIWDGVPVVLGKFWWNDGSGVSDFTDYVQEYSPLSYAEIHNATSAKYIVVGFPFRMRGISLSFENDSLSTTAATTGVSYWTGAEWTGVVGQYDGTSTDGHTFGQNGWVHWIPTQECSGVSPEAPRTYQSNDLLYYYRINFSADLSPRVHVWFVEGIPAQEAVGDYKAIDEYRFPVEYQGRLFLFGAARTPHKAVYSMYEAPDVFNGDDSGSLYFGSRESVVAAGVIYNVFLSTGFEQLLVTKSSETYRLYGDGPENWEMQQMSRNVGCVAPLSFVVCEVSDVQAQVKRNVAIWQSTHGFVMCDGATIQDISDDISVYFDSQDTRAISRHRIDDTVAWYDPDVGAYKALISSGAEVFDTWGDGDTWDNDPIEDWGTDWENTIDYHNVELEYSLKYQEWTKVYREDSSGALPLQVGMQVKDTNGRIYTYGAANNGYMYRLEYGRTWDNVPITQSVWTKDLLLDPVKSMLNYTTIGKLRFMFIPKLNGTSGETVHVTHYGDNVESVSGVLGQIAPLGIDMADVDGVDSQRVELGRFLRHSFKFECSTSNITDGMELTGFSGLFETYDAWDDE